MNETIVAISTPAGESAIAAVRLSGADCGRLAREIFQFSKPDAPQIEPRKMHYADYRDSSGRTLDDVMFCLFRAPNSYTGEDMLEIYPHGNPYILRKILDDLCVRGARLAQAGEFTRRAFLNDKFDLSQAEAVAKIIGARSEAALTVARKQFGGEIGRRISQLSSDVLDMKALIEAYIDFPDEDLPPSDTKRLCDMAEKACAEMARLAETSKYDSLIHDGIRAVIAGAPNAGKSSLMNAILGRSRAIVSSIAGTTRDFIDERFMLGEFILNLTDTAGLREGDGEIESEGIRRACGKIADCDLCLLVADSAQPFPELPPEVLEKISPDNTIIVLNKSDLPESRDNLPADFRNFKTIKVSCQNNSGIDELKKTALALIREKFIKPSGDDVVVGARHARALERACESLKCAERKILDGEPSELVASDLAETLDALGEIVGKTDSEEVLDRIFSKFCIGK